MSDGFDIDLLNALVAVVDTGSFTAAAAKLNATQPTISLKIARLEAEAGHQLLTRSRKGIVSLTREGTIIETLARETIRLHHLARRRLKEPEIEGVLRVGMSDDIASGMRFIDILGTFSKSYPCVRIEIEISSGQHLLTKKRRGELDFVICKLDQSDHSGARLLWKERLYWASGREIILDTSEAIPLVTFMPPCLYSEIARSRLSRRSIPWRIAFVSPGLAAVSSALRAGLGITVLPRSLIAEDLLIVNGDTFPDAGDVIFGYYRRDEAVGKIFDFFDDVINSVRPS